MFDTLHVRQVVYEHCVIKRMTYGFGLFTLPPLNDPSYQYFITEGGIPDSVLCVPMWTKTHQHLVKETGFEDCTKLAQRYEKLYLMSDW